MDARIDVADDEGGSDAADELVRRRARPVAQVDILVFALDRPVR